MSENPSAFVSRLWSLCNVLRGDGIGYNQYISELTYLLFLKIAKETKSERLLPIGYRWDNLALYKGHNLLGHYQELLTHLGAAAQSQFVRHIYAYPTTVFSHSENLAAVIAGIDSLNWHSLTADSFGVIYEGLLAKNSEDSRGGAGQYFTPRALVECMVAILDPRLGETIQDPAVGTGGFLISADQHVRSRSTDKSYSANPPLYEGMEIERGTYRLCLMNAFLHRLRASIHLGDALTQDANVLSQPDVVIANPPFGSRSAGARLARNELTPTSSNKQLQFLQHIYQGLRPGGRAAVVVPDNVLFEQGHALKIRNEVMDGCALNVMLRLPVGIFYAQNVSTHVLFFHKRKRGQKAAQKIFVYDLRSSSQKFGKRNQLARGIFEPFISIYSKIASGNDARTASDKMLRQFKRQDIENYFGRLSVGWADDTQVPLDSPNPVIIAGQMLQTIKWVTQELEGVIEGLSDPTDTTEKP